MSYKPGDLSVTDPPCDEMDEYGDCPRVDHSHAIADARAEDEHKVAHVAYLPHSCDAWVIGGEPEVRALIHDLTALLARAWGWRDVTAPAKEAP